MLEFLKRFEPNSGRLLSAISPHISDEMLIEIAAADYGEGIDEHLSLLEAIRDSGEFREPFHWYPGEVLELVRWSEPDDQDWRPSRRGEFGHWMRAFSCVALLRSTREPVYFTDSAAEATTIQMLQSFALLPIALDGEDVRFLAWLVTESSLGRDDLQTCAYSVALLWSALQYPSKHPDDLMLHLAKWITEKFSEEDDRRSPAQPSELRELGMPNQKSAGWNELGLKFAELDLSMRSPELETHVRLIGEELLG
jgi:hypothetical protein